MTSFGRFSDAFRAFFRGLGVVIDMGRSQRRLSRTGRRRYRHGQVLYDVYNHWNDVYIDMRHVVNDVYNPWKDVYIDMGNVYVYVVRG